MLIHTVTRNNIIPTWLSTRRYHLSNETYISQRLTSKLLIGTCLFIRQTTLLLVLHGDFVVIKLSHICMTVSFHLGPQNVRKFTVLAYLDDFLIISDTAVECQLAYQALMKANSGFKLTGIRLFSLVSDWHFSVLTSTPCAGNSHCPNANSANCDCYLAKQLRSDLSQNGT